MSPSVVTVAEGLGFRALHLVDAPLLVLIVLITGPHNHTATARVSVSRIETLSMNRPHKPSVAVVCPVLVPIVSVAGHNVEVVVAVIVKTLAPHILDLTVVSSPLLVSVLAVARNHVDLATWLVSLRGAQTDPVSVLDPLSELSSKFDFAVLWFHVTEIMAIVAPLVLHGRVEVAF